MSSSLDRPMIPIKKTDKDIEFYLHHGKKFNIVLSTIKNGLQSGRIKSGQMLCDAFTDECAKAWGSDGLTISYPFLIQQNSIQNNFPLPVCISVNDSAAHGSYLDEFKRGDIVSVDFGLQLGKMLSGLVFDSAFTVEFGSVNYEPWVESPLAALKALSKATGIKSTNDISKIIQDTAGSYRVNIVNTLTGHGIGHALHEPPFVFNCVGNFVDVKLFNNLCLCVEPIFVKKTDEEREETSIAEVYMESDQWEVKTTNEAHASHWETMFCFREGRLIDLVGITEW